MKVQIHEEKFEPAAELQRTAKLILTREEYDDLNAAFCKGRGWSLDYPHTVNLQSITLKGNYKWIPASDVEFSVEIG